MLYQGVSNLHIYAITQTGMHKNENEDRIVVGKTILSSGMFRCTNHTGVVAVVDGVGGNNAGGIASHFVANRIGDVTVCSKLFFEKINNDLITLSNSDSKLQNMATTLTGFLYNDSEIFCYHIGNSRIYSLQAGNYLRQLTEDDTTLNYLIKTGRIEPDNDCETVEKNEITACFGAGNPSLFDIKIYRIPDAQTFLFTTDGVHDFVSVDELEEILQSEESLYVCCNLIADRAVTNGSTDDISVVIAHKE